MGIETADDAAVYRVSEDTALVQTVDFFTPIVDDPYLFGQIAAANALSDIYAMGGEPLTAMNIVAFPPKLGFDVLQKILLGGRDKIEESGAVIVGGHTVEDKEPKYGLAVTGLVCPGEVITNAGAKAGDRLVLTKPLGMGILATALKGGMVEEGEMMDAIDSGRTLNASAAEAMRKIGVSACTDVTGFGFLGHLSLMLTASGVSVRVEAKEVPIWSKAIEFAEMGLIPAGAAENRAFLKGKISFGRVDEVIQDILFDPQTSGGLLISVPTERCDELVEALKKGGVPTRAVVGEILRGEVGTIEVI